MGNFEGETVRRIYGGRSKFRYISLLPTDRYLPVYVSLSVLTEILRRWLRMTVRGGKGKHITQSDV